MQMMINGAPDTHHCGRLGRVGSWCIPLPLGPRCPAIHPRITGRPFTGALRGRLVAGGVPTGP